MNPEPLQGTVLSPADKRALLASLLRKQAAEPRTFPASFAQRRLWFLDQLTPGNPFYNVAIAVRMKVPLLVPIFERSLNEIVRRHGSLRTTFTEKDGEPLQVVARELPVSLPVIDLRELPSEQREVEGLRLAAEEAARPFDLFRGPLLRAALIRLGESDHIFLLTLHHIISDGWSMGVFSRELTALYGALAQGRPSPLVDLPLQYADFAVWQRSWLQGEVRQRQLDYWSRQLEGAPVLQLPTDHQRPSAQSYRGATHTFHVSSGLASALKRLAQTEGATLFITLLTAFKALLHRYTLQDDLLVGSYIANRNRAELEGVIGFFVNTLVLRTDVSGDPTFRQLLRRVREVALGAYAHQDLPFEMLVEHLQPERDLSRNPIFQVVFQVPTGAAAAPADGSSTPLLEVKPASAIFDLSVSVWESGVGLTGQIEYACDLFDPPTIERLAAHLRLLLKAMVDNADQPITQPTLVTPAETRLLLETWNTTARVLPEVRSVTERFEQQARQTPAAAAFLAGDTTLTFAELEQRSNQLAHALRDAGVGTDVVVGVCVERSFDLVVALLAVWKAGGVYLPLDPAYPAERLTAMATDAAVNVVVTRTDLESCCPDADTVIRLDTDRDALTRLSSDAPTSHPAPGDLAYIIFTSGSTGRPKGVAVEHRQILNRLAWMWADYPFGPSEVGCQKTALNFVDSLWELLGPLLQGLPTVILPDAVVRDPWELIRQLGRFKVTRLWLVPSLLRSLLEVCPDLAMRVPHLKFWVSSGEPLSAQLLDQFQRQLPDATLYNLYGTSEVWDVTWFVPSTASEPCDPVPIGRPIPNLEVYVLNARQQLAPPGVPGELCVGGAGLARGYLNQAELNADRFIPHPFRKEQGARLYRTGDLARFRSDGNLEFLGRVDQQVKIRGFRVEPAEIEAALVRHPAVKEAVVVARDGGAAGMVLTAYLVSRVSDEALAEDWRSWLERKVPEPMIPAAFVVLPELPLLPNGKINRRALPAPESALEHPRAPYAVPQTAAETAVASVWSELLKVRQVGVNDHFFRDLGGHSLLATQVVSRLRNQFKIDLPLRALFEHPSVRGLSQAIERATLHESDAGPALVRLARDAYRVKASAPPSSNSDAALQP
jgi:amino acid adenylation domain-containing protein